MLLLILLAQVLFALSPLTQSHDLVPYSPFKTVCLIIQWLVLEVVFESTLSPMNYKVTV